MPTPDGLGRSRSRLLPQLLKFGAVGGVGFVINVIVFNALRLTVFDPVVLHNGPLYATIVATLVAIMANWVGNRYWAFSGNRRKNAAAEGVEFFLVSLAGMGIPLLCVWLSHYVLGYTSLLADNFATNVIGLALGALFRFGLYRYWVFSPTRGRRAEPAAVNLPAAAADLPATASEGQKLSAPPDGGLVGEG